MSSGGDGAQGTGSVGMRSWPGNAEKEGAFPKEIAVCSSPLSVSSSFSSPTVLTLESLQLLSPT